MKKINLIIKRLIDLVSSIIGLIILSPLLLIISLVIKVESKGPVIFKQKRLGKYGKEFSIFKFRTMVNDAEKIGTGLKVKTNKDPRITTVGNFLRKTSLDELPQLANVVIGNMSLVGPRPPVTYHPYKGVENYPLWAKKRFEMKPGVTGLAQVKVRNSVSWDERIKYDNKYVNDFNIWLDIKILFMTIKKVILPENLYLEN